MRSPFIAPAGAVQPDQRRRVEDLHLALNAACLESGAPELRDVDFTMDESLQLQYLDDHDYAQPVTDGTPIGLLKIAKAMRAFRGA